MEGKRGLWQVKYCLSCVLVKCNINWFGLETIVLSCINKFTKEFTTLCIKQVKHDLNRKKNLIFNL